MPQFLEKKLKERYGEDSSIPYKIMNARGFMRGNKITKKGEAAEKKHMDKITQHNQHRPKRHVRQGKKTYPNRYQPTGLIRGLGGVRGRAADNTKSSTRKPPSFAAAMNRS